MATIDWRELWPLANTPDFISLEAETRTAFRVAGDSGVGRIATFYHTQLAKYDALPYAEFLAFADKWIPQESLRLVAAEGTPDEQKMMAFYLALRTAFARHTEKRNKPTQAALSYLYDQKEGE